MLWLHLTWQQKFSLICTDQENRKTFLLSQLLKVEILVTKVLYDSAQNFILLSYNWSRTQFSWNNIKGLRGISKIIKPRGQAWGQLVIMSWTPELRTSVYQRWCLLWPDIMYRFCPNPIRSPVWSCFGEPPGKSAAKFSGTTIKNCTIFWGLTTLSFVPWKTELCLQPMPQSMMQHVSLRMGSVKCRIPPMPMR